MTIVWEKLLYVLQMDEQERVLPRSLRKRIVPATTTLFPQFVDRREKKREDKREKKRLKHGDASGDSDDDSDIPEEK